MRLYRLLMVVLLPPAFRREFGSELLRAVDDRMAGKARIERSGLWLLEVWDLVCTGAREWFGAHSMGGAAVAIPSRPGDGKLERLWRDIRFAVRTLRRAPVFSAVVVLTLALGIGANTAIFSVVDAVLLERLPYQDPERLVSVWQDIRERGGSEREWFSYEGFLDVRSEPGLLEAFGVWAAWGPTLTGVTRAEVVQGGSVSHEMLSGIFRVRPMLGRLFTQEDDVEGAPGVVVLSHGSWRLRFGGDPSVIGSVLTLDDQPFTVVGVLPEGFRTTFLPAVEMYRSLGTTAAFTCLRGCFGWQALGRLAPGVDLTQARVRAAALGRRLAEAYPQSNTGMALAVYGLREDVTAGSARSLWVLLGAVGFVLLIASTNVTNLVLARSTARRGELGVRVALGAGRGQLMRQLLTESFVLAILGGLLGLALAAAGTQLLLGLAPPGAIPRIDQVALDGRILVFTAGVTIITAFLVGLAPAWHAAARDVQGRLRAAGRGTASGGHRLRGGLAVLQVGMALILLVGAGLLLRSFQRLRDTELGFDPNGVLTFRVGLSPQRFPDRAAMATYYSSLLDHLRMIPRVQSAGGVFSVPLGGVDADQVFQVEGEAPPEPGVNQAAWIRPMTDGYLETVGLPLRAGRRFREADDAEAPLVIIVNRVMADRYYGGDAVGKRLAFGRNPTTATWRTIVGVTEDVRQFGIRTEEPPAVYLPYRQTSLGGMAFVVRASEDPARLIPAVRAALVSVDPEVAASAMQPLEELVETALAPDRFVTLLLAFFAGTALLIAVVGIYGVISYGVSQRYREMGIRMALGADSGTVSRLVVRGGLRLIGTGVLLGLVGAVVVTRTLGSLLYEVPATDPVTFLATTALLAGVALFASWLPARRAGRTDLVAVLREE